MTQPEGGTLHGAAKCSDKVTWVEGGETRHPVTETLMPLGGPNDGRSRPDVI